MSALTSKKINEISGLSNYILNPSMHDNTVGWLVRKNTVPAAKPDSGFVSGGTVVTWVRSTSSPLRGVASAIATFGAVGDQIIYDFTIDAADKGKVLQGSFDYAISSGSYADDSVSIWIYDITNNKFIQPAPYVLKNHSLPSEKFPFEFQTSIDSVSYRLVIHQKEVTSAALKFDNFSVGPQAKLYGSAVTDWVSYTPTTSWPSNTSVAGKYRQVGDSIEGNINISLTGVPTSSDLYVSLPSGLSINTTKLASSTFASLGTVSILDSGTRIYIGEPVYKSATELYIAHTESGNTGLVNQSNPMSFTTADNVSISFKVPILGFSSSQIMSHDANTRVIAARFNNSSTSINSTPAKVVWTNTDRDDVSGYSSGTYTVKTPGWYDVDASLYISGTPSVDQTSIISIYRNGSAIKSFVHRYKVASNTTTGIQIADRYYFNAGDTLEIYCSSEITSAAIVSSTSNNVFSLALNSGQSQIMASESVSCRYTSAAGQSIANATTPVVVFGTRVWDTHGAYNSSTGVFTAPISGEYELSPRVRYANGQSWTASSSYAAAYLYKNSSSYSALGEWFPDSTNTPSNSGPALVGSGRVMLLSGETADIRTAHNEGSSRSLLTSANHVWLEIRRVGNYA